MARVRGGTLRFDRQLPQGSNSNDLLETTYWFYDTLFFVVLLHFIGDCLEP